MIKNIIAALNPEASAHFIPTEPKGDKPDGISTVRAFQQKISGGLRRYYLNRRFLHKSS